jgi:hypothetical protein
MDLTSADIPLLRLNWVSARARKRDAGVGRGAKYDGDAARAGGVMLKMATFRLQIRRQHRN